MCTQIGEYLRRKNLWSMKVPNCKLNLFQASENITEITNMAIWKIEIKNTDILLPIEKWNWETIEGIVLVFSIINKKHTCS